MRRASLFLLFSAIFFSLFLGSCKHDEPESNVSFTVIPPAESSPHGYQSNDLSKCKLEFTRSNGTAFFHAVGLNSPVSFNSLSRDNYFARAYGYDKFGTPIALSKPLNFYVDEDSTLSQTMQLEWYESGKTEDQFCIIVFDTDGGSLVSEQKIKSGEKVSLPSEPTKEECSFDGWFWDSAKQFAFNFDESVTWSLTLHAKWIDHSEKSYIYISQTGNDLTGDGTEANPYATISRATAKIQELNNSATNYYLIVSGTIIENAVIPADIPVKTITISGKSETGTDILDGGGVSNVLVVKTTAKVTLKNITLKNGLATTTGGGGLCLTSNANVILESGTVITGNRAELKDASNPKNGGGVFVSAGATLTMNDGVSITNNTTYGAGGGVNLDKDGATFIMNGGTISGNIAGVVNSDGSVSGFIASGETTVKGGNGGGIRAGENTTIKINGGSIIGNKAYKNGGGIFSKGSLTIYGGTVKSNTIIVSADNIGIASEGEFHVGKDARIDPTNAVYLGDSVTITIDSTLSASSVAVIKPKSPAEGNVVLSGDADLIAANYEKFSLVSQYSTAGWEIQSDGTISLIQKNIIYVSETGNNSNSGLNAANALKTITAAFAKINDANNDWIIKISGTIDCSDSPTMRDSDGVSAKSVTIEGTNSTSTDVLMGNGSQTTIAFDTAIPVTIKNLRITKGGTSGISILGSGDFKIKDSAITGCEQSGVKISSFSSANVEIEGSVIGGEGADINTGVKGGGIYKDGTGSLTITDTTIKNNKSTTTGTDDGGGGIYVAGGTAKILDGTIISGNYAENYGGGIYLAQNASLILGYAEISSNEAKKSGGGIFDDGILSISSCQITSNKVTSAGGGICVHTNASSFAITNGIISGNMATNGGGISCSNTTTAAITISSTIVSGNIASNTGGGIAVGGGSVTVLGASKINGYNAAKLGGGVYINTGASFTLNGGEISENKAVNLGGAVYNQGTFSIQGASVIPADLTSDAKNDVYLVTGSTITVPSTLSGTAPIATITPESYTVGTPVLGGTKVGSEYTKFDITPKTGETWGIASDGKLVQSVSSGITISVPTYTNADLELTAAESGTNYVFTAKGGYASYLWTVNGLVYTTIANTVTIPKAGLPLTNVLMLVATDSAGNVHEAKATFTVTD